MKIKLISPSNTLRPMDSAWKTHMSPPLSLLVLAALTPSEHEVTVCDANVKKIRTDDSPDLVGLSVKVDNFYKACRIANDYRSRGIPVVMGGIHPTVCPEQCAEVSDCVVVGEAEQIWPRLLQDLSCGRLQRYYHQTNAVDTAKIPVPKWELVNDHDYLFTNTIRIGRGCPFSCDFCYNSSKNIDSSYRMKPVGHILNEIESLGTRHVMFIDDNFIGDPVGAKRLLLMLKKRHLTGHTAVSANISRHPDLLDLMAESGCKSLFIGFETMNADSLRECSKSQNRTEQYAATIAAIHGRGMMVNASVVFGFDNDDLSVFSSTTNFLREQRISTMTGHILTPYPGTALYRRLTAEGRIVDNDLEHYNTAHAVFLPKNMSRRELEQGYLKAYDDFYSWSSIIDRWPASNQQAAAYLQFQLLYRKYGKVLAGAGKRIGMRRLAKLAKTLAYPARLTRRPRKHYRPSTVLQRLNA